MQYYVPPATHRADEAACCCRSCTSCGKPCCSKRNWTSFFVGLAVILQFIGALMGLGVREDWLRASKSVFVGNYMGFASNYTQLESFSLSGSVTEVLSCYMTVDGARPWRETGRWCTYRMNNTAAVTGQVLPTKLMGVDWDSAQRRIRSDSGAGVAFGLFATALFMMSGPHWPRCLGGPGSSCEGSTHSHVEIAAMKKQSKYLLAGLICSLISWSSFFGCLGAFNEFVREPLSSYYQRNAISTGRGWYSPITEQVGAYDLPTTNPAYGYTLYEGVGFGLTVAAGVQGTVAFCIMLLVTTCFRGARPCQGPGSLGPDHPTTGAAREGMAAPGEVGHPAYSTVPQAGGMAPYGYAIPVAQAVQPGMGMGGGQGMPVPQAAPVPYGMNYGATQGMPPGYYPPTTGMPMQGAWYPAAGGYVPPGPGMMAQGGPMGAPMPSAPQAAPGQVTPQGMMYPPQPMQTQAVMPTYAAAGGAATIAARPAKTLD